MCVREGSTFRLRVSRGRSSGFNLDFLVDTYEIKIAMNGCDKPTYASLTDGDEHHGEGQPWNTWSKYLPLHPKGKNAEWTIVRMVITISLTSLADDFPEMLIKKQGVSAQTVARSRESLETARPDLGGGV